MEQTYKESVCSFEIGDGAATTTPLLRPTNCSRRAHLSIPIVRSVP